MSGASDTQPIYRLLCYREAYADASSLDEAKARANAHIRACPEGAMEWATHIQWYELDDRRTWVSAAKGEWLDHWIDEVV